MNLDNYRTITTFTEILHSYTLALQELLSSEPEDAKAFESWLTEFSTVAESIDELWQRGFVKYSQDISNEESLRHHHEIAEAYDRRIGPLIRALEEKAMVYLREYGQGRSEYQRLAMKWKRDALPFDPRVCDLQGEERELLAKYDRLISSVRLNTGGREFSFRDAVLQQYGDNEDTRTEAKRQFASWLEANDIHIQSIFSDLVKVRHEIALASGYENFVHHWWNQQKRPYSPEEVLLLARTIEISVVPVARQLKAASEVSPAPLPELQESKDFLEVAKAIACRISPKVAVLLNEIIGETSFDIGSSPTKWQGTAYLASFHSSKRTFIMVNSTGSSRDLTFFLHELGHAWHSSLSFREPLFFLRRAPRELEELVAISFEFLATGFVGSPFPPEVVTSLKLSKLAEAFDTLSAVALWNTFGIWAYTNPTHSKQERESVWEELSNRFRESSPQSWRIDHSLFQGPFFPAEYAFAQLGAIELTAKFLSDPVTTIERLEEVLLAGGARPFNESFLELGLDPFPSAECITAALNTIAERFGIPLQIPSGIDG